ncbi:response regulator [Cryptosporangium sp. NPDC051539]|uniref:response regulator n=1 Tax=Cryptosporangium sp. NPDC051539 TaxID=3363962 RepID=UPI0037BD8DEE
MHDVLAHRLSLLSLHAGALEIRTDARPEEIAAAAGVIRVTTHAALEDLRSVIGVLRADGPAGPSGAERPQPGLTDLPELIETARAGRWAPRTRPRRRRPVPPRGLATVAAIRVLLVDDDPLVRTGLRMLLAAAPDLEIVGEAADGGEALTQVDVHSLDVVLMDIRMPAVDGLVATERLRHRANRPHVVMLTTFSADENVLRALRASASGFLLKDSAPQEIIQAVRTVVGGEAMLSPSVTRQLIEHLADTGVPAQRDRARTRLDRLTARERDVALAVGQGRSNAEIAADLRMSLPTVKAHVSRLLAKLDAANRVQVALLVHDARWPRRPLVE